MVEVKVKVKVKVSGSQKKTRKPRKDKGTKRGKRGTTANPQFSKGSIDFRTIGTNATSNPTLLAGLISSRAVVPQYLQPQQPQQPQISTELAKYAPRDLPKNVPPPQFKPDTEQAQEETPEVSQATEVRQAMGERIGRLRKEEASLFLKGKIMEAKNMKLGEELTKNSKRLIEQQDVLTEQRNELITGVNAFQAQGLTKLLKDKGIQPSGNTFEMRKQYLETKGLTFGEDFKKELKTGRGGGVEIYVPVEKQDLQRAQEERPAVQIRELEDPVEPEEEQSTTSIQKDFRRSASPRSPRGRIEQARKSEERAAEVIQEVKAKTNPEKKIKTIRDYTTAQLARLQSKYEKETDEKGRKNLRAIEAELLRRREEEFGQNADERFSGDEY